MILVRDIFQIKFGRMKEALASWKEMEKASPMPAGNHYRILTDLTGQYYTLVLEATFKDLADYEKFLKQGDGRRRRCVPQEVRAPGRFGAAGDLHRGIE